MKIIRRGARADNGPSSIELNNLVILFENDSIIFKDSDVKDFVTKAHHDYKIILTVKELSSILEVVGALPDCEMKVVGKALEGNLKGLLRIIKSAVD